MSGRLRAERSLSSSTHSFTHTHTYTHAPMWSLTLTLTLFAALARECMPSPPLMPLPLQPPPSSPPPPSPPSLRHGRPVAGGKSERTGEGVSGPWWEEGGRGAHAVSLPSKSYRTCETFMEGEERARARPRLSAEPVKEKKTKTIDMQ